jgi:hypothetical protein
MLICWQEVNLMLTTRQRIPSEAFILRIEVFWENPTNDSMRSRRVLYVLLHSQTLEILYIGKAYRQNVLERCCCPSKSELREWGLEKEGIDKVRVLVGTVTSSQRLTEQLISDIERLLIYSVKPRGNIAATASLNINRQELSVECLGRWPLAQRHYAYSTVPNFRRLLCI